VGLAVAMFSLYSFAPLVPALHGTRRFATFGHALAYDPLSNGLELAGSLVLLAVALAGAGIGVVAFQRRDVAV
jgi:putative exporter of polyketide antibiotics